MQMTMMRPAEQTILRVMLALSIAILIMGRGVMALAAEAEPKAQSDGIIALYDGWADVEYATKGSDAKQAKLQPLQTQADTLIGQYPQRAEPLIWSGILYAAQAQVAGSRTALGLAEKAKAQLEKGVNINPNALDGAGITTLGALYDRVPGWPLAFGSSTKARDYLEQGVKINPLGMESNYFYAQFLYGQGQYRDAVEALNNATQPPTGITKSPGVDGRRKDIESLSRQARRKIH